MTQAPLLRPTKPRLTEATVASLVENSFGEGAKEIHELPEGMFNAVYGIVTDSDVAIVLKVSPAPDAPSLTYENDLLRSEKLFWDLTRDLRTFPVPEVLRVDFSREIVAGDAIFSRRVDGETWWKLRHDLSRPETRRLRGELGEAVAELHTVSGPRFGYPQSGALAAAPTWREAFTAMVDNVLDDAARWRVRLPASVVDVRASVERNAPLLDDATVPTLVHFDLWAGNVLLVPGRRGRTIEGIIDGERMFFGDPLADFASLALFGDIETDRAFLAGYRIGSGDPLVFDDSVRRRLALYKMYLYLLMVTEAAPRGYPWTLRLTVVKYAALHLARELRLLGR